MEQSAPQALKPELTASFGEYLKYYLKRKNCSQSRLAVCARLNQPQINKMINGKIYNLNIDVLVCICLALRLTPEESADLLARAERALSPASAQHMAYRHLIKDYAAKPDDGDDELSLEDADRFLLERCLRTLPNIDNY